jgi:uncharacterized membrane protein
MDDVLRKKLERQRTKLVRRNQRYARMMRRWAEILVSFLLVYVTLPFVAPTLMNLGATGPGNVLYTIYSPLCHQFAFRSMFLYGEQVFYPRAAAGYDTTFEERAAASPTFVEIYESRRRNEIRRSQGDEVADAYHLSGPDELGWSNTVNLAARSFRGDDEMGYKVALCARDIAIYIAMVIGGILFLFVRKRLRPVPLPLYILLGLGPIALDGFSQLFSYPPFEFWDVRESIPIFRVGTGFLFGLMNVWLAFPYLERSFRESADDIDTTIAAIMAEQEGDSL